MTDKLNTVNAQFAKIKVEKQTMQTKIQNLEKALQDQGREVEQVEKEKKKGY